MSMKPKPTCLACSLRPRQARNVVIARNGKPVVRMVPVQERGKPQPDVFKGKFVLPDSFFEPLPEEELKAWEG